MVQRKHGCGGILAGVIGRRIVIFETSASGKSTMAVASGKKLDILGHYLDQLCFILKIFCDLQPAKEIQKLHRQIIDCDEWAVMVTG
ncbi:MAG: hypothetical protein LBD34_01715 [Puniceicoccales bacterium]|nr:hypothetical protein [Puniceicoccales bacterium]